eukprot:3877309-Pyramimonas_sp.AAC.1
MMMAAAMATMGLMMRIRRGMGLAELSRACQSSPRLTKVYEGLSGLANAYQGPSRASRCVAELSKPKQTRACRA